MIGLGKQHAETGGAQEPFHLVGGDVDGRALLGANVGEDRVGNGAVPALGPGADDAPVGPHGRPTVAVAVEEQPCVCRIEIPVALLPAHGGGIETGKQRHPRFDRRAAEEPSAVASSSVSSSAHPGLPSRSTSTAPDASSASPSCEWSNPPTIGGRRSSPDRRLATIAGRGWRLTARIETGHTTGQPRLRRGVSVLTVDPGARRLRPHDGTLEAQQQQHPSMCPWVAA